MEHLLKGLVSFFVVLLCVGILHWAALVQAGIGLTVLVLATCLENPTRIFTHFFDLSFFLLRL
jgi:hypothetical protein